MPSEPAFKIFGQLASCGITRVWLAFQTFGTDCFQIAIKRWHQGAQFGCGFFSRLLNDLQRVFAYEWRSRSNLIQALAASHVLAGGDAPADRSIRGELLDRLGEQTWTDFGSRNVIVRDGVVHLWGLVGSPQEHKALLALTEQVAGVKGISDETFPAY